MGRLKLTVEERGNLLKGIEDAKRRLNDYDGDELTEADARTLLRDTIGDALNTILRNHKSERRLN